MKRLLELIFINLIFLTCIQGEAFGNRFEFSADYLYWTAEQRSLEYLRTGRDSSLPFPGADLRSDRVHEPEYDWHSGFRIGLGFLPQGCCAFRPGVEYTHFDSKGKSSADAIANARGIYQSVPSFPPTVPPAADDFYVNGVATARDGHSKISLYVDYLDLNIFGSECYYDACVFHWTFGARGAVIRSNWRTLYTIQIAGEEIKLDTVFGEEKVQIDWKYGAGGIKFSGGFAYQPCLGLQFYQDFTGSLLLGRLRSSSKAALDHPILGEVGICDISGSRNKIVPVLQSETGIEWVHQLDCGYLFQAKIAFEYMKWFQIGENRFYTIPEGARYKDVCSDLDLYGLTVGLAVGF